LLSSTCKLVISTLISKWRITREPRVQRHQTNPDN
jgi:hypothetical protein